MKKSLQFIMVLTIVLTMFLTLPVYAEDLITVTVDDEYVEFTEPPIIQNGRTLVPLRAIFEALNIKVEWDQDTKEITATKEDATIKLKIDDLNFIIGNDEVGYIESEFDVAPQIINDTTYVPVRLIGDLTGCYVGWEPETKNVSISIMKGNKFTKSSMPYTDPDLRYEHIGYFNKTILVHFGIGDRTYGNGERYVGGWVRYNPSGYGIMYRNNIVYKGNWIENKMNGYGEIIFPDDSRFAGNFKDGRMNGYGEFYFSAIGEKYMGNFSSDCFDGYGIYYYVDGTRYEGEWKRDSNIFGVREGEGTLYYPDGSKKSGIWKDDVLIKKY